MRFEAACTLFFPLQTALIGRRCADLHASLGVIGGTLAAAMVALGSSLSIVGARRGFMGVFPNEPTGLADPRAFLTLGLGDIVLFALFAVGGLRYRADRETHKRTMLLATISLLPAAVMRFPPGAARIPLGFAVLTAFLLAGPIFDWKTRGRVHPVITWGGLLIFVAGAPRPAIGKSAAWQRIATWLVQ